MAFTLPADWQSTILVPTAVFLTSLIATLWLRALAYRYLGPWQVKLGESVKQAFLHGARFPSMVWCFLVSAYLGFLVSPITANWPSFIAMVLWTIFMITITWFLVNIAFDLLLHLEQRIKTSHRAIVISKNVILLVAIVVTALGVLQLWGFPTSPLIILIALALVVAAILFRDVAPNLFAGIELLSTQRVKIGDYIRLESGEQGEIKEINWANTTIETVDQNTVIIPNRNLVGRTITNYGHPLKKAKAPFRFSMRSHLRELTGLRAINLFELLTSIKTVPESVIYFHTHHFLEEHQFLVPEPSNDFAVWVSDALGDNLLSERLASVDTFSFTSLKALRDRLVGIIEEYMAQGGKAREATPGREFYFVKSISVILPSPYLVTDLREFEEALRKISVSSLYFHIFESRLRLGRETNDFSAWLDSSMDEPELAQEIARVDPYTYTLEGLRSLLIHLIEKRIPS